MYVYKTWEKKRDGCKRSFSCSGQKVKDRLLTFSGTSGAFDNIKNASQCVCCWTEYQFSFICCWLRIKIDQNCNQNISDTVGLNV